VPIIGVRSRRTATAGWTGIELDDDVVGKNAVEMGVEWRLVFDDHDHLFFFFFFCHF
jgi:hypothetical protein